MGKKSNTKSMIDRQKQRSKDCRALAMKAVKKLAKNNKEIDFVKVADECGLSRTTLYKYEEVVSEINKYRDCQNRKVKIRPNTSEENKDNLINILNKEIENLNNQLDDLKSRLNKQEITLKKLEKENIFLKKLKYEY